MPGIDADALSDVAAFAERWTALRRRQERVPGVQVAIRHRGRLITSFASGVADETTGEPLTTRHRFRIASHSKMATATIVGHYLDERRLRLDDRVDDHVAAYAGTPMGQRTVHELLSHSGGIRRDGKDADHWILGQPFPDADALFMLATDHGDVLAANVRAKYSNIGFGVIGSVLESVGAASFGALLHQLVVEPLELRDTAADIDASTLGPGPVATGHTGLAIADRRIPIDQVGTGALAAATGLVSTAEDVTAFLSAHALGDERLVSDATKRLLHRSVQAIDPEVPDSGYALGFQVARVEGRTWIGHGGGWPGHITQSWLEPTEGLAVSVLTNAIDGPAGAWANAILKLLGLAMKEPGATPEHDRATLGTYEGRWTTMWRALEIVAIGRRLVAMRPESPDPVVEQQVLEVVDADTLRYADDGPGLAAPGELIQYGRDVDGTVRSIRNGGVSMVPLDVARADIDARAAAGERVEIGRPIGSS